MSAFNSVDSFAFLLVLLLIPRRDNIGVNEHVGALGTIGKTVGLNRVYFGLANLTKSGAPLLISFDICRNKEEKSQIVVDFHCCFYLHVVFLLSDG
jgi:hypothetical protein